MRNDAIDQLRGFAIFLMLLVNFPGSWSFQYPSLTHAKEPGFTLADLVFPIFLWTVGYSIQISLQKHKQETSQFFNLRVLLRFLILIFCGLALSLFPNWQWDSFRIPGVLQRIAFCYLLLVLAFRYLSYRWASITSISLATVTLMLNRFFLFQNETLTFNLELPNIEQTLGASFDRLIFGSHLWKESKVYDPEGLLTSIGALMTVYFGIQTFQKEKGSVTQSRFIFDFLFLIFLGFASIQIFPLSKSNWSLSFIWLSAGIVQAIYFLLRWISSQEYLTGLKHTLQILFGEIGKYALFLFFATGLLARTNFFSVNRSNIFLYYKQLTTDAFLASLLFSFSLFFLLVVLFQMKKVIFKQFHSKFKSLSIRLPASFRFDSNAFK